MTVEPEADQDIDKEVGAGTEVMPEGVFASVEALTAAALAVTAPAVAFTVNW